MNLNGHGLSRDDGSENGLQDIYDAAPGCPSDHTHLSLEIGEV